MIDIKLCLFWILTLSFFALLHLLHTRLKQPLWARVMLAMAVGAILGLLFSQGINGCNPDTICVAGSAKFIGDIFVRLIRMLIVPLIFTTLVSGIVSLGHPSRLGSLGGRAMFLYVISSFVAVAIGLSFGAILKPGNNININSVSQTMAESARHDIISTENTPSFSHQLIQIIPENPIGALANGDILPTIFWAILFGIGILFAGSEAIPVSRVIDASAQTVLKITMLIMEVAPFGVYGLVSWMMGAQGLQVILHLGALSLACFCGFVFHVLLSYCVLIKYVAGLSIKRFFQGIIDAQVVAFSTASSNATLPVTISTVTENLGVDNLISSSVLPLGATINMDGTAIYLGVITLFACQALNIDLSEIDYLIIAVSITLASIGAAGVPSAGLLIAVSVFKVVGISEEQTILVFALLLPFDRLLDMMRTTINVTGDAAVAVVVAKWEKCLDIEKYNKPPTI